MLRLSGQLMRRRERPYHADEAASRSCESTRLPFRRPRPPFGPRSGNSLLLFPGEYPWLLQKIVSGAPDNCLLD